jgi:hypothetical protein
MKDEFEYVSLTARQNYVNNMVNNDQCGQMRADLAEIGAEGRAGELPYRAYSLSTRYCTVRSGDGAAARCARVLTYKLYRIHAMR